MGAAALVYEASNQTRSVVEIEGRLRDSGGPKVRVDEITRLLAGFVEQRLMVRDGGRYLSLAVMDYAVDDEEDAQ